MLRKSLFLFFLSFGLNACGQDPLKVCVLDASNAPYGISNPLAITESCQAGGDLDLREVQNRNLASGGSSNPDGGGLTQEQLDDFRSWP